jgi:hypothetical protein
VGSERQERAAHEAQDGETHGVISLAAPLFCYGERFELTVRVIDYRYIPIDCKNTVREAARSVNAKNYWSLKREVMPIEAARAVYNSAQKEIALLLLPVGN